MAAYLVAVLTVLLPPALVLVVISCALAAVAWAIWRSFYGD